MNDRRDPKQDRDSEPDALLDSLLRDPIPSRLGTNSPTVRPLPAELENDDVTVVGRGIEELLAQSFSSDSSPPGPLPSKVPAAPTARPAAEPPRPAGAPRPAPPAPPRPRSVSDLLPRRSDGPSRPEVKVPPPAKPALTPMVPPPSTAPARGVRFGDAPAFEEEETRVLRVPSEISQRASALSQPVPPSVDDLFADDDPPVSRGSAAPTRPPLAGAAETRVPLAPRLPSGEGYFTPDLPPAADFDVRDEDELTVAKPSMTPGGLDSAARTAWKARAEWMEAEAHTASDPQVKARTLLVASELWAIVGESARAREVAAEASTVTRALPLVSRQQRWLSAAENDYRTVATLLEIESRNATNPDAKLHAAYLGAEIQRLKLDDADAAKKKLEACARLQPEDPRAHLVRIAEQLTLSPAPPKRNLPDVPELAALSQGLEELARVRNPGSAGGTPVGALEELRRAFTANEREAAGAALTELGQLPELSRPARLLKAALFAHEEKYRGEAQSLLDALLLERDSPSLRRALAARSLETGNAETLARALLDSDGVFSASDRVALAALVSGARAIPSETLGALPQSGSALSVAALLSGARFEGEEPECGSPESRALLRLGRTLTRFPREAAERLDFLTFALAAFAESHPDHGLTQVLGLEVSLLSGDPCLLGTRLGEWPRDQQDAAQTRDAEVLSALFYELGGNAELARSAYERALIAAPSSEFATRAQIALQASPASELLEQLAESEASGTPAALHFLESALRRSDENAPAFDTLLEKAAQADPALVLPYRLGELDARAQGDTDRLLGFLRGRRSVATDPLELALDLVREALLRAGSDPDKAASLLREAIEACPADATLWELLERLSDAKDFDRAGWRQAAAQRSSGATRNRLLLEAAWEYERSGQRELAVQAAREANQSVPSALARLAYERLAPGTPEGTQLSEELLAQAKDVDDALERRELYRRLSAIDDARGEASSSLLFQTLIVEQFPHDLSALRRLEAAHMANGNLDGLEAIEAALAETLSGADAVAAAQLAARLRLLRGDWAAVRPLAELSLKQVPGTLWALRSLSSHARANDETAQVLELDQRLYEWSSRPLDRASLSLRTAESAARLGLWELSQREVQRALDQVPDHFVGLTALAEVLEAREDFGGAARAWEAVAEASSVDAHRVAALHRAGTLWLDRVSDVESGRAALEQAVALDLSHEDAVARLQALYVSRSDRQRLADLLARRLERTTDPEERIAIEVTRGRALAEVGEPGAARAALAAALDANPNHLEALEAFSELCLTEGDWLGAEQSFIRLARHSTEPVRQAQI